MTDRRWSRLARVAAIVAVVLLLAGCTGGPAASVASDTVEVDCATFESTPTETAVQRSIDVAVDVTFRVSLCSNASTGSSWADPSADGDPVLNQTGSTTETRAGAPPGAAGRQVFAFETIAAGTTTLRFTYGQPWDGGTKDVWQLELSVTVT